MTSPRTRALLGAALGLALLASAGTAAASDSAHVAPRSASESSAPPSGATTWALEPTTGGAPDGRVSLRHEIEPGASVADEVTVTNFGSDPATFAVYASDGLISAEGSFDLLPPDQVPVDGGSWISLSSIDGAAARDDGGMIITIEPESTAVVPVTITVPDGATPGDHPAGIVAEFVPDDTGSVQLASRVGVRAHLRVAGDVVPSLTPDVVTTSWTPSWNPFAPGTVSVTYTVANDGNVRLGAATAAAVAGAFGVGATTGEEEIREILPGQQRTVTTSLRVWPLFFGWGQVTVDPVVVGEDEVAATSATATPFTMWVMPWSQLGALAVLVLGILLFRWSRRRSAARLQARIDAAVAEARTSEPEPEPEPEHEPEEDLPGHSAPRRRAAR
jgi:hypothetical protein